MASQTPDPELLPIWNGVPEYEPPSDVAGLRIVVGQTLFAGAASLPLPENCTRLPSHTVTSADGTAIELLHFIPKQAAAGGDQEAGARPARAIIHCFGGGFVMGSAEQNSALAAFLAVHADSQVFVPGYRVAPEHPAPAALEDVHATLVWVQAHAAKLGVDPARVVLFGISAGGGLASGVALMARDRSSIKSSSGQQVPPPPAGLALRYPMLDDRTTGSTDNPEHRYHTWNFYLNDVAWTAYAGGKTREERTDENTSIYMAPGRARPDQLQGLPPTFVDVGGLDLFRGEDARFATALTEAGVEVEFHHHPGLPHGAEAIAPGISNVRTMNENLIRFMRRF